MKSLRDKNCHRDDAYTTASCTRENANNEIGKTIEMRRHLFPTSFEVRGLFFLLFLATLGFINTNNYRHLHRELNFSFPTEAAWKADSAIKPATSLHRESDTDSNTMETSRNHQQDQNVMNQKNEVKESQKSHTTKATSKQASPELSAGLLVQYSQEEQRQGTSQHTKRKLTASKAVKNQPKIKKQINRINHSSPSDATHPQEERYCSPWEVNVDDWWQDHPDWEVSDKHTNDTHTCFRPIVRQERANLLREVHTTQFPNNLQEGCKRLATRQIYNVGFGFNMYQAFGKLFYTAFREGRAFRPSIQGNPKFQWLYVPPYDANSLHWASCQTQDHECYFLPVSSCPRPAGGKDETFKRKYERELFGSGPKKPGNSTLLQHKIWMDNYLMRPRQALRHKFYQFMQDPNNGVPTLDGEENQCSWIHVRRADAMSEEGYVRNFYPIQKYLERGNIRKNETVLLFTDDDSAIEEAILLHPEYNWVYFNRTRHRGPVEINSHIPSHDPSLEVLILLAEKDLAARCDKGVHGKSSYFKHLQAGMIAHRDISSLTFVEMDKGLKKDRIEAEVFMKGLNARLEKARKGK